MCAPETKIKASSNKQEDNNDHDDNTNDDNNDENTKDHHHHHNTNNNNSQHQQQQQKVLAKHATTSSSSSSLASSLKSNVDDHDATEDVNGVETASTANEEVLVHRARLSLKYGTLLGASSMAFILMAGSMIRPYAQSRRDTLGCDTICLGRLSSARSALTLIGAAIMGRISDMDGVYGSSSSINSRILCLYIGILCSGLSIWYGSRATSISDLWISLLPNTLQQNSNILKALFSEYHDAISIAAATATDGSSSSGSSNNASTTAAERAATLGTLGMMLGISIMIGPMLGGKLFTTYEQTATASMVFLVIASILIAFMPIPNLSKEYMKEKQQQQKKKKRNIDSKGVNGSSRSSDDDDDDNNNNHNTSLYQRIISSFRYMDVPSARSPAALFLLGCRLSTILAYHIYSTIWNASLRSRFPWFGPADYGNFFSIIGLAFALSQGLVAPMCLKYLGGDTPRGRVLLLSICSFIVGLMRYVAFYTTSIYMVYLLFAIMVIAIGISSTIFTADTSRIANSNELGSFFGVVAAVENGAGIIGPLIAGTLTSLSTTTTITSKDGGDESSDGTTSNDNSTNISPQPVFPLYAAVLSNWLVMVMVIVGYERLVLGSYSSNNTNNSCKTKKKQQTTTTTAATTTAASGDAFTTEIAMQHLSTEIHDNKKEL